MTSPPASSEGRTRNLMHREKSPYYVGHEKSAAPSRPESVQLQSPLENPGSHHHYETASMTSSQTTPADSGYNPSNGSGQQGVSPNTQSQAPGTFLFGGKTNVAPPRSQRGDENNIDSEQKTGRQHQQQDFEPEVAEAAMSSMTSIKKELEKKISELECERNDVAKQGLSKYK